MCVCVYAQRKRIKEKRIVSDDASKKPRPSRSVAKNPSAAAAERKPTPRKERIKRNLIERAQGTPIGSINYSIENAFRARARKRESHKFLRVYVPVWPRSRSPVASPSFNSLVIFKKSEKREVRVWGISLLGGSKLCSKSDTRLRFEKGSTEQN